MESEKKEESNLMDELQGIPCFPKTNCPHFKTSYHQTLSTFLNQTGPKLLDMPCKGCGHSIENWVCLECHQIGCSQQIKKHMQLHYNETKHPIVVSQIDVEFWCQECASQITNAQMDNLRKIFQEKVKEGKNTVDIPEIKGQMLEGEKTKWLEIQLKESKTEPKKKHEEKNIEDFAPEKIEHQEQDEKNPEKTKEKQEKPVNFAQLASIFETIFPSPGKTSTEELKKEFKYSEFIEGLKENKFKKIVIFTGAGISVSAGIPDFRTPGTGLYSRLSKYNLPFPEAMFHIEYYKSNPKPFYELAKEIVLKQVSPVITHYFLKILSVKNQLLMNQTQNVDGLELDAGLQQDKLVQAHGHFRKARCIGCKKEKEIEDFKAHVLKEEIMKQINQKYACRCECGSLVKPDVIFFGEGLPPQFFTQMPLVKQADLAIVIGTALKVFPFSSLIALVPQNVPLVVINRENPLTETEANPLLLLLGDLDKTIEKIIEDCGWSEDLKKVKKK